MFALLLLFASTGLVLIATGRYIGPRSFLVGAVPMSAALAWVATKLSDVTARAPVRQGVTWVESLGLRLDLRLDGLSATLALIVAGVGVCVMVYSWRYFGDEEPEPGRLAGLLVLFGGAMFALALSDNVFLLYVCWELTTVTSYLLIGNRHTAPRARGAALHALLITGAGGLALLGGLLLLTRSPGSARLSVLLADPPRIGTAAVVLVLAGAFTKSAQYPFHSWLPGAMAAPTPVSAYLHSATMVKAGVFLVALLAPIAHHTGPWHALVVAAGVSSMLFGGLRALRQQDIKLLLAFGTVSQLGLLTLLFGLGTPAAATAGWFLLVAHALYKATLFMVVGIVDRGTGTRDVRELPPLGRGWRGVEVVAALATLSMAGVPFTAGFVAKELAYEATGGDRWGSPLLLVAIVAGATLTVAYSARFYWCTFVAPRRRRPGNPAEGVAPRTAAPGPGPLFVLPAAALTVVAVVVGLVPGVADRLATASLAGFGDAATPVHLAAWHGPGLPLLLSLVALAGGALIAALLPRLEQPMAVGARVPSGGEIFLTLIRGIGRLATRVTAVVQNGSLPVYAGVILLTAAVLPAGALLVGRVSVTLPPMGGPGEAAVVALLLTGALGAAIVHRRFAAALFLSVAGYSMAGLFVLSGAPDLALTQVAVETLSTVVFVLVLRRLPEGFEHRTSAPRRVADLLIAGAVAAAVFAFVLLSAGFEHDTAVSDRIVESSVPLGHGHNVVNVTLVDFRGFDTLGEISVLIAASIGAVALARAGRGANGPGPIRTSTGDVARLAFLDVAARIAFPAVLLMSLWLLFSGHDQPGGGFVGGLLAGAAITIHYLVGGIAEVRRRSRLRPWTVLGTGLLLAAGTASFPLVVGDSVLEVGSAGVSLPLLGKVPLSSALVFDVGVYLAVVGMVLMAFEAFGDNPREVHP
ncbi:MAG: hydrogen gas-evolving membrane-bound hydrogenase subunit E [Microthrixaceae bacterium]